jgi:hypothetical protein
MPGGTTAGSGARNQRFLTKEHVEAQIFEIMNPFLYFEGVLPDIRIDARSVTYKQETTSASSDTNKKKPKIRTASSDFTFVNIEKITPKSAILNQYGFAARIDREAIRYAEGIDEINRAFRRIGFWLAQDVNQTIVDTIEANATGPTTKLGNPTDWDAAGASPVQDLMNVSEDMRQEGYPYRATDIYLHDDNWYELNSYVTFLDNRRIDATTTIGQDNEANVMSINVLPGMTEWGLLSSVTAGDILALDRNNPAGAQYHSIDPEFSVTRADGSVSPLQVNTYRDQDTHDTVIQVWKDYTVAIKEPLAAIYASSVI